MANLNIKIMESNDEIKKQINAALAGQINKRLTKSIRKIETAIIPVVRGALMSSPEIASLKGGVLQAEFGLQSDPTSQIISAITESLNITFQKVNKNLDGGFLLEMQPTSFSNVLSLSVAEQLIEGGRIPWLNWLLTAGDSILIANFGVEFGSYGRTGKARMSGNFAPYKVHSSFSGTPDNNFITRAITAVYPQIKEIIRKEL
jgi:hypothetical protein|tara:strand:- start:7986 stop:8594 length:609 start_codon:yes stop_codon:yes gene_type:complete